MGSEFHYDETLIETVFKKTKKIFGCTHSVEKKNRGKFLGFIMVENERSLLVMK